MLIGRVIGQVVATQKDPSHAGTKILRVQPLDPEGRDSGDVLLALDGVDAGVGDRVLVTQDGWSASWVIRRTGAVVDAAVIGVVDTIDLD
jgi:ethanolamine utilization protein EutN